MATDVSGMPSDEQQPYHGRQPYHGQQPPYGGEKQPPYFPPPRQEHQGYFPGQQAQQPPGGQWQQPTGQPAKLPRKSHRTRNIILGIVGAFVLIIVIAVATNGGSNSNNNAGTSAQGNTQQPAGQTNTSSPASEQTTSAPPAAPQYTASQQQAIDAANGYLSMGSGFSYQGLIDQLDSSAGNGFSTADATFAVNHVQVDWNQQAVLAAKGYMQMGGFSCSGMVEQLDSPDGSQFTQAQAEYAAAQVGLGNC